MDRYYRISWRDGEKKEVVPLGDGKHYIGPKGYLVPIEIRGSVVAINVGDVKGDLQKIYIPGLGDDLTKKGSLMLVSMFPPNDGRVVWIRPGPGISETVDWCSESEFALGQLA